MSGWFVIAFAVGLYPFICLCVAITGPHSEFERKEMLAAKLAKAAAKAQPRHEGWTERGHAWLDAGCPPIAPQGDGNPEGEDPLGASCEA